MTALHLPTYLLGRALGPLLRPLLRRVDAYVTPALDIDWSDPLTDDDDWPRECEFPADFCLGAESDTGGTVECAACLALDPEEPCIKDPEVTR